MSGVAFRYAFMGAHMAVENHAEVVGEFMQRRVNFLISALGSINASLEAASETIDVDVQIQPYTIDNLMDNIEIAVKAIQGGVWSQKHGIMFAGNIDNLQDELNQIKEEQAEREQTALDKEKFNQKKEG